MSSAKFTIKTQDRSAPVPSFGGVYAGMTIISNKGPVNEPILVTSRNEFLDIFGSPDPSQGVAMYSALTYLTQGNKLWVVRSAHEDVKYAGVLIRSKVIAYPQGLTDVLTPASRIVKPLEHGLTQEEFDSYSFPVYSTNKLYAESVTQLFQGATNTKKVRVSTHAGFKVNNSISFSGSTLAALNSPDDTVGEATATLKITALSEGPETYDKITLATAVTLSEGDVLRRKTGSGSEAYPELPTIMRSATNSKEFLVSNADYIGVDDQMVVGSSSTVHVFKSKVSLTEQAKYLELSDEVTVTLSDKIYHLVQSELEDRDSFLVTAHNQGAWGGDLSIATTPSINYDNAFFLIVYYKGVKVESWEVSRSVQLDGFGNQLYIEDKINGKSAYIRVKDNPSDINSEGLPEMPLFTDHSLWREDPKEIFGATGNKIIENLLKGHLEVKASAVSSLAIGSRIKFVIGEGVKLSKEYKILSINATAKTFILDRPIEETEILKAWINGSSSSVQTLIYRFDPQLTDSSKGIVKGIQNFAIKKLEKVLYNYPLNARFKVSDVEGKLVDSGANMMLGGAQGGGATIGDLVNGIKLLSNKESTPCVFLMDGGFTYPAFQQALVAVAKGQGSSQCHAYLSIAATAERSANYKQAIIDYKASMNLNTELASVFTGWVKIYDEYNQKEVWVSPESFAVASQSFTTRNYQMWHPAAGWARGKVVALDVLVRFSEGDRDYLVENRINPIRYKKGSGLVIWGNETLLTKPSPLQLRSVAMLLIVIKAGLEGVLEYQTFELNNERTWAAVQGSLDGFMRDEIQAKGGVYKYTVAIKDVITPSDLDNRRMPIFLGIQPTMDIKEIPVTLAIFNSSVDINVAL